MRKLLYILSFALLSLLSACKTQINDVPTVEGTDPMRFNIAHESREQNAPTRASQLLTSGFMVSCYKHYADATQQTVMPGYEVEYLTSGTAWDGSVRSYWRYDLVNGQYLRYWDLSAFPYRFHAIAPYPANTNGFVLTDTELHIPTAYSAQTCHNGMVTPANNVAEPHKVAQVQRGTNGTDIDLFSQTSELNNTNTANRVRDVWMPFHHLNSKIRFGIYHTTAWLTANKTYIQGLSISVTSPSFATGASGYEATISDKSLPGSIPEDRVPESHSWYRGSGHSGFTGVTTAASSTSQPHTIFRYDGGPEITENDLREMQTRQTAYFLQCPDGIMQIPQSSVQMTVSFDLMREDGTLYKEFRNVPVRLLKPSETPETPEYIYTFDWHSGYLYTYYLIISDIDDKLEITFTATLTPWEDISGSLSTDLEQ